MTPNWTENERLAALRAYEILDTPPEPQFDDIVRIASHVCAAPISLISLTDENRQWFKAEIGLGMRETSRDMSMCSHAILQPSLLCVPDTARDARFASNPLVAGAPHVRFYAGAPLETPEGLPLGTLCVFDLEPRVELDANQRFTLQFLARQVMLQIQLRRAAHDFNNLLQGIAGAVSVAQKLLSDGRTSEIGRYLATALDATKRTAELTARLMAFSHRPAPDIERPPPRTFR